MLQHRKPSSPFTSYTPYNESPGRRGFGRKYIVYLFTAILVCVVVSCLYGQPYRRPAVVESTLREGREQGNVPPPSKGSHNIVPPYILDAVEKSREEEVPAPNLAIPSAGEKLPLISTHGDGKVVLLTGTTGPGHFQGVQDFYSKIIDNRLNHSKTHGPTHPPKPAH